jgi:membrane protein DedA with SNARE-associated domain
MVTKILAAVAAFVIGVITATGYAGVFALMAIESACIPLPSEIIMPFAGHLVENGVLTLWWSGFWGAVGCVAGSLIAYAIGYFGGRPLAERYGRYVLVSRHDLDLADRLFARWGNSIALVARMLPVIRTYIGFPAGVARMPLGRFCLYSFLGSLPWCLGLAWLGQRMSRAFAITTPDDFVEHLHHTLGRYFHIADAAIGLVMLAGVVWYVRRHLKHS